MPILKCKMCGGDLHIEEGMTVCECEYCSTKQTVPVIDDEKKIKLFERANRLRMECQFDKAATVYESIIEEFDTEAEGYWGNLLCKYGIEYVDDPATGDKVPTCHRSSFDSIMDDKDFDMVMENCDAISRNVYRDHAKQIEEIRKGIIEVSGKEEPYDIFICYKETAEDGQRTLDSVLAQDIYDALVDKGYRVFFSRITLEDKLGTEYEPYIFAALNSAKIMLAFGTTYDYYNAVWVKNEWSRYLKLMAKDKTKHLIPCYKDIDAYDIPKEFAKLQAQDLGKVGATQDLLRGVEKIIPKNDHFVSVSTPIGSNNYVAPLLERVEIFLSDRDWEKADEYCEKTLDLDPKNAQAYLGKLLVEFKTTNIDSLANVLDKLVSDSSNFSKVVKFADDSLKQRIETVASVQENKFQEYRELKKKSEIYDEAEALFEKAKTVKDYSSLINIYEQIKGFKDADEKLFACKNAGYEITYVAAMKKYKRAKGNVTRLSKVAEALETISEYKDAKEIAALCKKTIADAKEGNEILESKASDIFKQYSLYIDSKSSALMEDQLVNEEEDLITIENGIKQLENNLSDIASSFRRKDEIDEKVSIILKEKNELVLKRGSLGFFAIKEKKAIDEQISSYENQEKALINEIEKLLRSVRPYSSYDDAKKALLLMQEQKASISNSIDMLKEDISSAKSSEVWSEEKVYELLLNRDVLGVLLQQSNVAGILMRDEKVTQYIKDNPIRNSSSTSIQFDTNISKEQLFKLEKLNYWELPADKRSEEELLDDIEDILYGAELLDNYDIEREVSPEYFNANLVNKKHGKCYENGKHYDNGDVFDVNHYGKPASFVIKDCDGNVRLLIMLGKDLSFDHWLVMWSELWCEDNDVPILRFYVGRPNTEHYIVRKVYEKMGLIEKQYKRRIRNPATGVWIDLD